MRITCKAIVNEGFIQFYITVVAEEETSLQDSVAEAYSHIGEILSGNGIAILQEKIYGLTMLKSEILMGRAIALTATGCGSDASYMFIDGAPVKGNGFAGVQIWGVSYPQNSGHSITTVSSAFNGKGRLWKSGHFAILCLPHLKESCPENIPVQDRRLSAARMFERVDSHLAEFGFRFDHVIRTWIYLPQLLDWYGEFNAERGRFFRARGIGDPASGSFLPASTCIQGRCEEEECTMELMAVRIEDGSKVSVSPVRRTSRQGDAFAYGASFSRAVRLEFAGNTVVFCSGTASIDRGGATVGVGDPVRQCEETLDNVEALLREQGGALSDVVSATLFCKNDDVANAWRRSAGKRLPADFPLIVVHADICREELLVELEATAVFQHEKQI